MKCHRGDCENPATVLCQQCDCGMCEYHANRLEGFTYCIACYVYVARDMGYLPFPVEAIDL